MVGNQKICLLTDLDNTMIYSYRRDIGPDKIEVEPYQGRIVSYMTGFAYNALEQLRSRILFVPVTTRSAAQYRRIRFGQDWTPEYALVSNGATLLVHGQIHEGWKEESLKLMEGCREQLRRAEEVLLRDLSRTLDVRMVDDLFVFTKSSSPQSSMERLREALDTEKVDIASNGVKVYVIPKTLNKGTAVRRFLDFMGKGRCEKIFCAGDSEFDVSFLEKGHVIFCPEALLPSFSPLSLQECEVHGAGEDSVLSDLVVRRLLEEIQ